MWRGFFRSCVYGEEEEGRERWEELCPRSVRQMRGGEEGADNACWTQIY